MSAVTQTNAQAGIGRPDPSYVADFGKEPRVNVADELASFATPNGVQCKIATLATTHPAEYADLLVALDSAEGHKVVERWWNATRSKATGVGLGKDTISRHRGVKACRRCR
jgi:hypothetical protein